jgi:hypothetical protein
MLQKIEGLQTRVKEKLQPFVHQEGYLDCEFEAVKEAARRGDVNSVTQGLSGLKMTIVKHSINGVFRCPGELFAIYQCIDTLVREISRREAVEMKSLVNLEDELQNIIATSVVPNVDQCNTKGFSPLSKCIVAIFRAVKLNDPAKVDGALSALITVINTMFAEGEFLPGKLPQPILDKIAEMSEVNGFKAPEDKKHQRRLEEQREAATQGQEFEFPLG